MPNDVDEHQPSEGDGPGDLLTLQLYVAGASPNSTLALANLKLLLARLSRRPRVEVIDVLQEPFRPLLDGVLLTPTLVRVSPPPVRQIIGNLNDIESVLAALDVAGKW